MKVFIIGIAGGTGSRVAQLLAEQGDEVCGLCRRSEQIAYLHSIDAQGVVGDLATISDHDLAIAFASAEVVVFAAGAGEQDNDSMIDAVDGGGVRKAIAATRIANISTMLLVSVFPEAWRERTMPKSFEHYMTVKKRADVELVHSELEWVIVRPSSLTDDPGTGRIGLSAAEIHTEISRDDVAATIVTLLHSPKVRRRILEVTTGNIQIANAVEALTASRAWTVPGRLTQDDHR